MASGYFLIFFPTVNKFMDAISSLCVESEGGSSAPVFKVVSRFPQGSLRRFQGVLSTKWNNLLPP